jgi:choline kinase
MKAVILAAGRATRLLPLTKDKPQPLLKFNGKTILEYQIESLNESGIKDIIVVTGHQAGQIERKFKDMATLIYNPFYEVAGMLMSLWIVKSELTGGFIFLYSDVLFEKDMLVELIKCNGNSCLVIDERDERFESEKISTDNSYITAISKEIPDYDSKGGFIGIAKFSAEGAEKIKRAVERISRTNINAYFITAIQEMIREGEKISFITTKGKKWIDIDFEKDLIEASKIFSKIHSKG